MTTGNYREGHAWHGFMRSERMSGMQSNQHAQNRVTVNVSGNIAKLSDSAANG
jgi:hypothetical protein